MEIIYPINPLFITQQFGVNPQNYSQFGLAGHNGWDIRTKYADTFDGIRDILASYKSKFFTKGNEGTGGYGIYFEVLVQLRSLWKLTYAHCKSINIFLEVEKSAVMAKSDNTGNSTGAHLHWTVKKVRWNANTLETLNYNNGFKGALNPQQFVDELKEVSVVPITSSTKIPKDLLTSDNFKPDNDMEVQAIRSTLNDQKRDFDAAKRRIIELEALVGQPGAPVFNRPKAKLFFEIAKLEEQS